MCPCESMRFEQIEALNHTNKILKTKNDRADSSMQ